MRTAAAAAGAAGRWDGTLLRLRSPGIGGLLLLRRRRSSRSSTADMPWLSLKRFFCQYLPHRNYLTLPSTAPRWTLRSYVDTARVRVFSSSSSSPSSSSIVVPSRSPAFCPPRPFLSSSLLSMRLSVLLNSPRPPQIGGGAHTVTSLARGTGASRPAAAASAAAEAAKTQGAAGPHTAGTGEGGGAAAAAYASAGAKGTAARAAASDSRGGEGGGKDGEVILAARSNTRSYTTSLKKHGRQALVVHRAAASVLSASQLAARDEAAVTEAVSQAKDAVGGENRTPLRVLRSSCNDIIRNLAIECLLIDICGRPSIPPPASEAPSAATAAVSSSSSFSSGGATPAWSSSAASFSSSASSFSAAAAASSVNSSPLSSADSVGRPAAAAAPSQSPGLALDRSGSSNSGEQQDLQQTPVLFLWRNDKSIVIGRHQNAWKECDIRSMERDGVTLARRYSGGGAVYQDLGNTCFTFLDPAEQHCKLRNSRILLHALRKKYNITGSFSGRNDLLTEDGRKFSGFAYSKFPRMWLHHGTLMREVDCEALARYLTPSKAKLRSKGIDSVAARVANLRTLRPNITHEGLCDAIAASFAEQHGWPAAAPVEMEDVEDLRVDGLPLLEHPLFRKHFDLLASWDWRFSRSPAFHTSLSTRFSWGSFDVHLNVENATITDIKIYSDCLHPDLVDALSAALTGCRFTEKDLKTAVKSITLEKPPADLQTLLDDFANWFATDTQQ